MSSEPLRIETEDRDAGPDLASRVDVVLRAGQLVLLPTETVYGVAARADDEAALARLCALKGLEPGDRPWTWHVGEIEALDAFAELPLGARRLAGRYWPGPLTLVLPGTPAGLERVAAEDWTGVRLPAHRATASLLAGFDYPVVMSSANRTGAPPATDVAALAPEIVGALALLVDAGPARIAEPSSVLRLGRGRFELLRAGLHDLEQLRPVAGLRIGFACTGNTCRSPMAEGLARAAIAKRLGTASDAIGEFGFSVRSMGVFASPGAPAADHAIEAMRERDIDITAHRSRPALPEVVSELDHLYCLTQAHLDALRMLLPPGKDRTLALLDPDGRDIPDPIGGTALDYRRCAESIQAALEVRIGEWA